MRLPGGRTETLEYMARVRQKVEQFPVGTQFALIEQAFLISDEGEMILSPLTVSISLRAYLDVERTFQRKRPRPSLWPNSSCRNWGPFAHQKGPAC